MSKMDKEEIVYKIEQIAHNAAFDGLNANYVEREAEKLADKIVKLFAIPVVVGRSEQFSFADMKSAFDYASNSGNRYDAMTFTEWMSKR